MKIVSIKARAVDCGFQKQALQTSRVASPMSQFARFAETRSSWMWPTKKVFVQLKLDNGVIGWGCTNGGEVVELIINSHLAQLLRDQQVDNVDELWQQMVASLLPNDRSGFAMMSVAGVDIAIWDALAKSRKQSLLDLLGGSPLSSLPVYFTTARPERFRNLRSSGLKAAAPYGPESGAVGLQENIALLERFAAAAGPGTPIMVDAFMAWDVDYTLRFAEAAKNLPIKWIEDPLPADDLAGFERLRAEMNPAVALALGNFAYSMGDFEQLLRLQVVDIFQPDVAWAGGITEALRMLKRADESGVPVILHNTCEQPWALALAAARQHAPIVEVVDRGDTSPLYSLMGPQPKITDGRVSVPSSLEGNRPPEEVELAFAEAAIGPHTENR